MNYQHAELPRLDPKHRMMELFTELSLIEKCKKVWHGLNCPRQSGEYKYAIFQLQRLISPAAAVIVPILMLLVIIGLATQQEIAVPKPAVKIIDPKPVPKIEPPVKPKTETFDRRMPDDRKLLPDPAINPCIIMREKELSSTTPPVNTFRKIVSPMKIRGLKSDTIGKVIGDMMVDGGPLTPGSEQAVLRSLRWLQSVQEPDGSWRLESGGSSGKGSAPAMTSLALLTFVARGITPASDEFGLTVEKAMKWLVANQESDGRFKGRDQHDYSLPIAGYALCESFLVTGVPLLKEAAEKSLELIINGQHADGGWDYNCKQSRRSDTSYTGWCVQALKAADIVGLENDGIKPAIKKAVRALKANAHPNGGFGYTGPQQSHLTGTGVLCMQLLGAASEPETIRGLAWLEKATMRWSKPWGKSPVYYWYYTTQAKYHAGGDIWADWNRQMNSELPMNQIVVNNSSPDGKDMGYWESCSETEHCRSRIYNTTLCTLMLEMAYRFLGATRPDAVKDMFNEEEPEDINVTAIPYGELG